MKTTRFCVIEPSDMLDRNRLKDILTIENPMKKSQEKFTGKSELASHIHLYEERSDGTMLVPRHFLADVKNDFWDFAKDHIKDLYKLPEYQVNKIALEWTKDPKLQLRETQKSAVEALATNSDLLHADCGSGKTIVCIGLINRLKLKTAVIVNQEFLAEQWKESLLKFTTLKEEDITINAGGELNLSGKVNICLVQTLIRRPYNENKEFYNVHSLVIADEVHTSVGSFKFREAIEMFSGIRKGVTATIQRTDKLRIFMWAIGNRVHRMDSDTLEPDINFLPYALSIPDNKYALWRKINGKWSNEGENLQKLINLLSRDEGRNNRISSFVTKKYSEGRQVIVLTHRREHTKTLYDLCDKIPHEDKVIMVGGVKFKDHPGCKEKTEPKITFATFQYVKQALDIPRLDMIVFTTPFRAKNDVQQAIGRILRQYPGKPKPEAYYIYDQGTTSSVTCARVVQKHCRSLGYYVKREISNPKAPLPGRAVRGKLTNDTMARALRKAKII